MTRSTPQRSTSDHPHASKPSASPIATHGFAPRFGFAGLKALQPLMAAVSRARTHAEIAEHTLYRSRELFGTRSCGVILADLDGRRHNDSRGDGITESQYDDYEAYVRPYDEVFAAVVERQVPIRLEQIWTEEQARASINYREFGRKWDLFHYISVPIYGLTGMIGIINLTRSERYCTFSDREFQLATALGGYVSAALARVPSPRFELLEDRPLRLSAREREIALLVAHGSSNPEIAATLQIARETVKQTLRRVYRKLDVRGRAQMVARLSGIMGA